MRSYKIQKGINDIITCFYRIGFWHRGPAASPGDMAMKLFYCILYSTFVVALMGGAIITDSIGESVFLVEISIVCTVLLAKLCFLMNQNEILEVLNGICIFRIRYDEDFNRVDGKIVKFMTIVKVVISVTLAACVVESVIIPIVSSEKYLFYKVAFPWDWRTNDAAYWAEIVFVFFGTLASTASFFFSIIIWYCLLNCSLRYEVLGNELRKIGHECDETVEVKSSVQEKENEFSQDLKESIDNHLQLKRLTDRLESFCFNLFLQQFCTSGLCICGSIYSLAFLDSNAVELLCQIFTMSYNIAEIFMITFFGDEILVSSDRLSYCLFQSNFVDQTESVKKMIIIYGEYLKQPHQLMIGSLYPLTLETFTMVLNGAYRMFNVLCGMQ